MKNVVDVLAEELSAVGGREGGEKSREVREDGQVVQEELTARQLIQNKLDELSRSESLKSSTASSSNEEDGGKHDAAMADMAEALVSDLHVSHQESHQEQTTDVQAFESDVSIANRNNSNNNRNLPDALIELSKRSSSSSSNFSSSSSSSDESLDVEVGNSETGINGGRRRRRRRKRSEMMSNVVEALLDDLNAKTGGAAGSRSQQDVEETGVEAFESDVTLPHHVTDEVTRERDEAVFNSLVDQMSIGLE